MEYIEIVEHYAGGKVIKRTANGIDIPISDIEIPVHFIHKVRMSKQDFENAYGIKLSTGNGTP